MYFTKTSVSLLAAGSFASVAQAHMRLRTPTPYPGQDQAPLIPDGSNFPCKNVPATGVPATEMPQGSSQELNFLGSVVHGGGSCQISLTYDNPPTASSSWKVIHSIQGGCPARNEPGNFSPESESFIAPDSYAYTIPSDIPAGNATLAWTWVNKVGNREFYMGCAPVSITGNGGSEAALEALPDMFVANIAVPGLNPGNQCTTNEGVDILYPNPGASVETKEDAALGAPNAGCGAAAPAGGAAAGGAAATTPAAGAGAAATPAAAAPAVRGRRAASFRA